MDSRNCGLAHPSFSTDRCPAMVFRSTPDLLRSDLDVTDPSTPRPRADLARGDT